MKKSKDSDKENWWSEVYCDKLESVFISNNQTMSAASKENDSTKSLLEKLRTCVTKNQDNGETIRNLLAKLHTRVTSSDRNVREQTLELLWRKELNTLKIFILLLDMCKDNTIGYSVSEILHESISPRQSNTKSKATKGKSSKKNSSSIIEELIEIGGTQVFLKLLINSQRGDSTMTEMFLHEILWMLSQLAQKDPHFSMQIRISSTTKTFHSLLKQYYNDARLLLPVLVILKNVSKNPTAVQILVKDGITATLEKTFMYVGYSPRLKLKVLLECFKYFTLNKLFCAKFVEVGMVFVMTRIFERWDKWNDPIRQKIASNTLSTLHHLCSIKAGRKAIKANNGVQVLYRFCINCPASEAYDTLFSRVCGIINQCLEKKELPVPEMSPARFNLPNINGKRANSVDSCSDVESQSTSINSSDKICSDVESVDDDDDDDDGDKKQSILRNNLNQYNVTSYVGEDQFFTSIITSQRSINSLLSYNILFKEFGGLQHQLGNQSAVHPSRTHNSSLDKVYQQPQSLEYMTSDNLANWTPEHIPNSDSNVFYSRKLQILDNIPLDVKDRSSVYCICANKVRSVIPFVKVGYPDLIGGNCSGTPEPLNDKDRKICRKKLLNSIDRGLRSNFIHAEVIFDLDSLTTCKTRSTEVDQFLGNADECQTGQRNREIKSLQFESRFESGNLRKVIQTGSTEYDLILTPDVNSGSRHQWFYFQVSNMMARVPYTFNIINCEKTNSEFNFGMKPILFSVVESQLGRPGWVRTGFDICYYRNCYRKPCKNKNYFTTSFTVTFPHSHDICYLAYHFPYTYSLLMSHIWKWLKRVERKTIYFQVVTLCDTLNNNECPLLTITAPESEKNPISKRKIIFLTSRIHPGESNSSWIMHGTLETLLGASVYAQSLRNDYVFKIIPMLNIEGVINGCNRYGLTSEDLNRRWNNPNPVLHPVVYHTKGLMEYCGRVLQRPPYVFVDYHGHSRRKNVFLFGCSRSGSWSAADREKPDQPDHYSVLPRLMQKTSPAFALPQCSFKVERNKESTARVAIWRQLGVARSYTMESSFCGCNQGPLAGFHLDTVHLKNVGREFCEALSFLKDGGDNWNFDKCSSDDFIEQDEKFSETEISSTYDSDDSSDND